MSLDRHFISWNTQSITKGSYIYLTFVPLLNLRHKSQLDSTALVFVHVSEGIAFSQAGDGGMRPIGNDKAGEGSLLLYPTACSLGLQTVLHRGVLLWGVKGERW